MSIASFAYPSSVKEAVGLLGDPSRPAIPVGGGTALIRGNRRGATLLVDVTRCGMSQIGASEDRIVIGAAARVAELARANLPGAEGRLLSEAAAGIATEPLRNAITVGGNLVQLVSWADLPVALLALDALVHVETPSGPRDLPMRALVEEHPTRVLPQGALITGVSVPYNGGQCGGVYRRLRESQVDYALVAVAACVELEGDRCKRARIAVGAVCPRPLRLTAAEQTVEGHKPTPTLLQEAAALAAAGVHVTPDIRMAPALRARLMQVEIRRALEDAVARARLAAGGAQ
ncbi:MAG: FAD binding domain-containing protein [Pseudomonadota bacterium]